MRTLDTSDIASYRGPLRGTNSVVECNLAKVEVVGSNPMSRSKMPNENGRFERKLNRPFRVRQHDGRTPK